MLSIINLLLNISVMFFANTYAGEVPITSYLSTQEKVYSKKDLLPVVTTHFNCALQAFKEKDYHTATMRATGAKEYATIMGAQNIYKNWESTLNYIAASSHMALGNPHLALEIFRKIHDAPTDLGIIPSKTIVDSLLNKALTLSSSNMPLSEKLQHEALYFQNYHTKIEALDYQKDYNQLPVNALIDMLEQTQDPQDLAINTLKITRSPEEIHAIVSSLENHTKTNNLSALCYLVTIYNRGQYGINQDHDKALNYAYQYVQLLAQDPKTMRPLGHFRVLTTLTEHAEKNTNAYKALHYCNYLQAIINNEPQKSRDALEQLKKIKDPASGLRNICIDILTKKCKSSKQAIDSCFALENEKNFRSSLSYFINTESDYIIDILENSLCVDGPYTEAIHYILGISYYRLYDYEKAFHHFSQTNVKKSDLPTQCKAFYSFNQSIRALNENIVNNVHMIQELLLDKKHTPRNKQAVTQSYEYINLFAPRILAKLIHYGNHKKALSLIETCFKQNELYQVGINLLEYLLSNTKNKNKSVYASLMQKLIASGAFKKIKKYAYKNNDLKSWKCLAHSLNFSFKAKNIDLNETDLIPLEKAIQSFPQLKNEFTKLQNIAGNLACYLAKGENNQEKKVALLTKAINWGNYESLSTMLCLIFEKNIVYKNETLATINRLEEMALNDSDKVMQSEAYNFLSKIYINIEENKNISFIGLDSKKSFDYAKKAYRLGCQESCRMLGIFYSHGINIQDNFPVEINYKKALKYFVKCITPENKLLIFYHYLIPIYENGDIIENMIEASKYLEYIIKQKDNVSKEIYEDSIQKLARLKLALCCSEKYDQPTELLLSELIENFKTIEHTTKEKKSLITVIENYRFDNNTLSTLLPHINSMINMCDNDYVSARNCFSLGTILYFNKNNRDNGRECLNLSIECIKKAAYYGIPEATYLILCNNLIPLSHHDKISLALHSIHLHNQQNNSAELNSTVAQLVQLLPLLHPSDSIDKCSYVIDLFDANLLDIYLSSDSCQPIKINENQIFNNNDDALLNSYLHKKILTKYIESFDNSHEKKIAFEKKALNAAILHASFLLYSSDKKNLLTSAHYFTKLAELSIHNSSEMEKMAGVTYYKLFTLESNKFLAEAYLIKSAEFKSPRGTITLTTKWLNNELIKKLSADELIELLKKITSEERKEEVKVFIKKCLQKKSHDSIIDLAKQWISTDPQKRKTNIQDVVGLLNSIKTKTNKETIDELITKCLEQNKKESIEKTTRQLLEQLSSKLTNKNQTNK